MNIRRRLFAGRRFHPLAAATTIGVVFLLAFFWQTLLQLVALAVAGRLLWLVAFGPSRRRRGRLLELAFGLVESVSLALIARNTRALRGRERPSSLVPYDLRKPPKRPIRGPGELPEGY